MNEPKVDQLIRITGITAIYKGGVKEVSSGSVGRVGAYKDVQAAVGAREAACLLYLVALQLDCVPTIPGG